MNNNATYCAQTMIQYTVPYQNSIGNKHEDSNTSYKNIYMWNEYLVHQSVAANFKPHTPAVRCEMYM